MTKKLIYLVAFTSSIGASVISIEIAGVQLSLFRGLIILLSVIMGLEVLMKNRTIRFRMNTDNMFSIFFMISWVLYALFSIIWIKEYAAWLRAVYFLALGLLSVLAFSRYIKSNYEVLTLVKMMSIMTYIHNIIGWYEIYTGNYYFSQVNQEVYTLNRLPVSMFGNTNNFATYLLFSVFIQYAICTLAKRIIVKLVNVVFIASTILLIFMTGSRANLLGLIMAIAAFGLISIKNKKILRIGLCVSFFGIVIALARPSSFITILSVINNKLSFSFSAPGSSESIRFNLMKNGISFLQSTMGFGTGAGNIEYWMSNYSRYNVSRIENIHNWWLEILVSYGVIIFFMYIIFYIGLLSNMYKKNKFGHNRIDQAISVAIFSCMVGYIIGSISSSSNISSEWLWVFWATAITFQGIKIKREN